MSPLPAPPSDDGSFDTLRDEGGGGGDYFKCVFTNERISVGKSHRSSTHTHTHTYSYYAGTPHSHRKVRVKKKK